MSYDCSWILENIGNVNLYTFDFFFLYFGLDHSAVVMLPNFC